MDVGETITFFLYGILHIAPFKYGYSFSILTNIIGISVAKWSFNPNFPISCFYTSQDLYLSWSVI